LNTCWRIFYFEYVPFSLSLFYFSSVFYFQGALYFTHATIRCEFSMIYKLESVEKKRRKKKKNCSNSVNCHHLVHMIKYTRNANEIDNEIKASMLSYVYLISSAAKAGERKKGSFLKSCQ
jgi:hypothetical protein